MATCWKYSKCEIAWFLLVTPSTAVHCLASYTSTPSTVKYIIQPYFKKIQTILYLDTLRRYGKTHVNARCKWSNLPKPVTLLSDSVSLYLLFSILGPDLTFSCMHKHKTSLILTWMSPNGEAAELLYSLQIEFDKQLCVQNVWIDHRCDGISDSPQVFTKTLCLSGARRILSCITKGLGDLVVRWEGEAARSPQPQF